DVDAARIEAGLRHAEHLRPARFRRIRAALQSHEVAGIALADAPHRVVDGTGNHRVQAEVDHRVARGIDRAATAARTATAAGAAAGRRARASTRYGRRVAGVGDGIAAAPAADHVPRPRDFSVAVGIDDLSTPADGFLLVLRLVVHL